MPKKKYATPEYIRKAVRKYKSTKKQIVILVEPEFKDKVLQAAGDDGLKKYLVDLIKADFEKKGISLE